MIIPSIDLMGGKAVQLQQGREKILENGFPMGLAKEFRKYGEIAVVDLDAALGKGDNEEIISRICGIADCRVGGGIRSLEKAKGMIDRGADKIILGTKAFSKGAVDHDFLTRLCSEVGRERLIIAIDSFKGEIVTQGWQGKTGLHFREVLHELRDYSPELLFTCVDKEGMMGGTDFEAVSLLRESTDLVLTAAGGISSTEEIERLSKLGVNVQLGMAVYTKRLSLSDAFISALNWEYNLLPTIIVDRASQVLMLAYSSRESLRKTFETDRAWYFSRSRQKLWMKGETSGNTQGFIRARSDCDGDAVQFFVDQRGPACHTGRYSCFGDRDFSLQELFDVVRERVENPSEGSYTSSLDKKRLNEKILEEAKELVEAKTRENITWEAADLVYFISVILAKNGVSLEQVLAELGRRRRSSGKRMRDPEGERA